MSRSIKSSFAPFVVMGTLFAVTLASLWGIVIWKAHQERAMALAQKGEESRHLVHSLAQHASKTFGGVQIALLGARQYLRSFEQFGREGADEVNELLAEYARHVPQVREIGMLDRNGQWLYSSLGKTPSINNGDRAYFQYHRNNLDESVRISEPVVSRLTGRPTLLVTQRLANNDGTFAGVVFAAIDLKYFRSFYEGFTGASNTSITMLNANGKVLVYRSDEDVGRDLSGSFLFTTQLRNAESGLYQIESPFDGLLKQFSYERLADWPIVISVAMAESDILSSWRRSRDGDVMITGAISAILIAFGVVLAMQIRSRQQAEQHMHAANDQLRALSETDALTGLANRRRFDEVFDKERRRAWRSQSPLAVLFVDIDLFKLYNDSYGHAEGDACLRQVAQVFAANLRRAGDLAARYGGEEFAIILPDTMVADAMTVAENLRLAVRGLGLAHARSAAGIVTVSIGVAGKVPGEPTQQCDLLEQADAGLYRAKAAGRDGVSTVQKTDFRPRVVVNG